jgi:hypothetical protein
MWTVRVEPEKTTENDHIFRCPRCEHSQNVAFVQKHKLVQRRYDVGFGSLADICSAKGYVRFTPNSDHKSRHAQMVMSALLPKADMCGAAAHVCYGPKADVMCLFDHFVSGG